MLLKKETLLQRRDIKIKQEISNAALFRTPITGYNVKLAAP